MFKKNAIFDTLKIKYFCRNVHCCPRSIRLRTGCQEPFVHLRNDFVDNLKIEFLRAIRAALFLACSKTWTGLVSKNGLDSISKTWTRLVKHGLD